ncbi:hypothetical protein PIROE2DRAFT_3581, partial [Piromyces sp. E2]
MNYSLYPDILPAHTKNPFQKDFFIKEEINNDDVLTKSKVNIKEDVYIDDPTEKVIMKRFISAVTKDIKNPSKDDTNLTEAYPSIEENIVKAASILFFSIGHSSLLHNKKNFEETIEDNESDDLSYDDGSDSDSSCNSETDYYYCGYYPMRHGMKKPKCEKINKIYNKKVTSNNSTTRRQTLNFDYYENLKNNNDPLSCIKNEFLNNNNLKGNDIKMMDNYDDNKMNIDEMNNDEIMDDINQSIKKKRNISRKKDIKMNDVNLSNNKNFDLLNQNNTFKSTLIFSNQTSNNFASTLNNLTNTNNLSNINNNNFNNELMIPNDLNNSNNLGFSSMPFRKIKCKTDNSNNSTSPVFINSSLNSSLK